MASGLICILQRLDSSLVHKLALGHCWQYHRSVCTHVLDCPTLLQAQPSSQKAQGTDTANLLVSLLLRNAIRGTRGTREDNKSFSSSTILALVAQSHSAHIEHRIINNTLEHIPVGSNMLLIQSCAETAFAGAEAVHTHHPLDASSDSPLPSWSNSLVYIDYLIILYIYIDLVITIIYIYIIIFLLNLLLLLLVYNV